MKSLGLRLKRSTSLVIRADMSPTFWKRKNGLLSFVATRFLLKALGELISVLTKMQRENMDRMQEDISWFIKKFDYRYEKESWGNSKDAVERTVNKLRGWCVGKEPNPEEK